MSNFQRFRWALLIGLNLFCWYMLGFHQSVSVAQLSATNGDCRLPTRWSNDST